MRTGHNIGPYAYGISHMHMGRPIRVWANIRIWDRTVPPPQPLPAVLLLLPPPPSPAVAELPAVWEAAGPS